MPSRAHVVDSRDRRVDCLSRAHEARWTRCAITADAQCACTEQFELARYGVRAYCVFGAWRARVGDRHTAPRRVYVGSKLAHGVW